MYFYWRKFKKKNEMTTNWHSKEEALSREPKAGHLQCTCGDVRDPRED